MHAICRLPHPPSYWQLDGVMFAYLYNKTKISLHALKSCMEICPLNLALLAASVLYGCG